GRRHFVDAVLGAVLEQEDGCYARLHVLAGSLQLAGERRAVRDVTRRFVPHVRDFVRQDAGVAWGELRDRRLAGAGGPRERECATVTDCARRMEQEATLAREEQRVRDAQHAVERIRIGGLPDSSAPRRRIPFRAKVAALDPPEGAVAKNADVLVARRIRRRSE